MTTGIPIFKTTHDIGKYINDHVTRSRDNPSSYFHKPILALVTGQLCCGQPIKNKCLFNCLTFVTKFTHARKFHAHTHINTHQPHT